MQPKPRWSVALAVCLALLVVPLAAWWWLGDKIPAPPDLPPPMARATPAPAPSEEPEWEPAPAPPPAPEERADTTPPPVDESEAEALEDSPGSIEGRVVDERGFAVDAFEVAVESFHPVAGDARPPRQRASAADDDGRFVLENLPPGGYVLAVQTAGRPPALSQRVEVSAGERVRGLRIALTAGGVLEGLVLDVNSGSPIAGANVAVDLASRSFGSARATTDGSGAYRLEGVPEVAFSIRVAAEGYITRVVSQISASPGRAAKRDVDLRPADGQASTEYAGIGAVLSVDDGGILLGRLFEEGPAAEAGLLAGDRLLRVDGADASGFTVAQAVQRLRGPEGSRVSLSVRRDGRTVEAVVTRARFLR